MKRVSSYLILGAAVALASCNDFLDKLPDSRTQIDTPEKVTSILVSAYPETEATVLCEMASDNAMDNGYQYTIESKYQQEAYLWEDVTETEQDTPSAFWESCYKAIATANQALEAIKDLGGDASMNPQKGEALMCRAWSHFLLANLFCQAYNPETADSLLGLPYSTTPETTVRPSYTRGTLHQLYENIEKDIEAGLPLISDDLYTSSKYHFNKKAAYAFAARFYLYYQKWDKVIACANEVLGSDPTSVLRNWAGISQKAANYETRCNAFIDADEAANLLLMAAYSSSPYYLGAYSVGERYAFHPDYICRRESYRATGIWGNNTLYLANSCFGNSQKIAISKYYGYFEYTDKVQQIGYRRSVISYLTTDETLLCRAEAYAMLGSQHYQDAVKDINYWLDTNVKESMNVTLNDVVNTYKRMSYMERDGRPIVAGGGTPKKRLHPLGFTLADDGIQENLIQCILHLRRCQTAQEGLRWMDIKRWGIEICHNREGYPADTLKLNDPRRAFQIPGDVIDAGLQPNPRTVTTEITGNLSFCPFVREDKPFISSFNK